MTIDTDPKKYLIRVNTQIIFRKKGFLGAWYNYKSVGFLDEGTLVQNAPVPAYGDPAYGNDEGFSPLNFSHSAVIPVNAGYPQYFIQSAWYRGYGLWVVFDTSLKGLIYNQ